MIDETLFEAEEKMDKALTVAREDFAAIRTGRATPAMFNKIVVDYYGVGKNLADALAIYDAEDQSDLTGGIGRHGYFGHGRSEERHGETSRGQHAKNLHREGFYGRDSPRSAAHGAFTYRPPTTLG